MKPTESEPELKPRIEDVFKTIASRLRNEKGTREAIYLSFEQGTLDETIEMALNHPGRERDAWLWMESTFEMRNAVLKEAGLPPMRYIAFETYLVSLLAEKSKRTD